VDLPAVLYDGEAKTKGDFSVAALAALSYWAVTGVDVCSISV
jgi:hypothetical protein